MSERKEDGWGFHLFLSLFFFLSLSLSVSLLISFVYFACTLAFLAAWEMYIIRWETFTRLLQ